MSIFDIFAKELHLFENHLLYISVMKENTTVDWYTEGLQVEFIQCVMLYSTQVGNQACTELMKKLFKKKLPRYGSLSYEI